jgi:hypothetical protein
MSTPSPALVPDPSAETLQGVRQGHGVQWAFERATVTAASNLIEELQRTTNAAVLAAQGLFFTSVAVQLEGKNAPDLYEAMTTAASGFQALGNADTETFPELYHAGGAERLYQYNVSTSWKKTTAQAHGLNPNNPLVYKLPGSPVYWIWAKEVANSTAPIPESMLVQTSSVNESGSWSWWTPSERVALGSSGSPSKGNEDYFTVCQVVSLAPDWYKWGLVGFNYVPADGALLKRPEPYDGANPLWVQRPADVPARTGGGAPEVLLGSPVTIAEVGPISAWIPAEEIIFALQEAPSVNHYADNLLLAWKKAKTDSKIRVAFWQTTVVEECRLARAAADRAFNRQAAEQGTGAEDDE